MAPKEQSTGDKVKFDIIEYIRSKTMFYNNKHKDYKKSKQIKLRDLDEFGKTLSTPLSGTEILNKWNQLRGQFSTYVKTSKTTSSGAASYKKKPWKFFESMQFLKDHVENSEPVVSIDQPHLNLNEEQTFVQSPAPSTCNHNFQTISEDDEWTKQCIKCEIYTCSKCGEFNSIENEDNGPMRKQVLICFKSNFSSSLNEVNPLLGAPNSLSDTNQNGNIIHNMEYEDQILLDAVA